MSDIRQINRILYCIPAWWLIHIFVALTVALVKFRRLPIFGIDPDPYSLSIDWLNLITVLIAMVSFFTVPVSLFLTLYLLLHKIKFTIKDKLCFTVFFLSLSSFFALKYFLPKTFDWILD